MLDYPATVVPVTKVDRDVDVALNTGYDTSTTRDANVGRRQKDEYDSELYHGVPVSVQIIGQPLCEEQLLNITEVVDSALKQARSNRKLSMDGV